MMYFDLLNNNTSYSFYPFIVTFNNCGTSAKKTKQKKKPSVTKKKKRHVVLQRNFYSFISDFYKALTLETPSRDMNFVKYYKR